MKASFYISVNLAESRVQINITEPEHVPFQTRKINMMFYKTAGNIHSPSKLFGREDLLTRIGNALSSPRRFLLYGMAGIGKTALAAAVADKYIEAGKGAVLWLEVANAEAEAVFGVIVEYFCSNKDQPAFFTLSRDEQIKKIDALLADSETTMVVLDDVWNSNTLNIVLKAIPKNLSVLATSRFKFPLSPQDILLEVEELSPQYALALLNYYAGGQDYKVDEGANELCRELGYHPYALEIAGAMLRVDNSTPEKLCQEIADAPYEQRMPLDFAEEGRQSMELLLDRSFSALSPEMQIVFMAFGAFFAPILTLDLLVTYLPNLSSGEITKLSRSLAQRSLIKRGKNDYYRMHDLTFSYVHALFNKTGKDYAQTVQAIKCFVEKHIRDFDLLTIEQDNILGAAKIAQRENPEALINIVSALTTGGYLDAHGHRPELVTLLDETIKLVESRAPERNDLLHYLLSKYGNVYFNLGKMQDAIRVYKKALLLSPNLKRQIILWGVIGKTHAEQKEYEEAEICFQRGRELAETYNDEFTLAFVLEQQSIAAGRRGDFETAREMAA